MQNTYLIKAYIQKCDKEIEFLISQEVESSALTAETEDELHVLFENMKHAKECLCEMDGTAAEDSI